MERVIDWFRNLLARIISWIVEWVSARAAREIDDRFERFKGELGRWLSSRAPDALYYHSESVEFPVAEIGSVRYRVRVQPDVDPSIREQVAKDLIAYISSHRVASKHLVYEPTGWREVRVDESLHIVERSRPSRAQRPDGIATRIGPRIADPSAVGFAALALVTFLFGSQMAGLAHGFGWLGAAVFCGLTQFVAGMWTFKTGNTFGATALASYGAFWMSLATFVVLILFGQIPSNEISKSLGWFFLSFFIFNSFMLILSSRTNMAIFGVFLSLEVTELLLWIGFFAGGVPGQGLVSVGGWFSILTSFIAWYLSSAALANSQSRRPVLPLVAGSRR